MEQARRVFRSATSSQYAMRDVLALFFTQELLAPSASLFLVEPWISNIAVLDNRTGRFDAINPDWGRREIRLIDVLEQLAQSGTQLRVVSRPNDHSRRFVDRLRSAFEDLALLDRCALREVQTLHTKGILTEHGLIVGSMNLTESGINLLDEQITIEYDMRSIAEARVNFETYFDQDE